MSGTQAAALRAELLALKDASGRIVPNVCVKWAARHRRSVLYSKLEWDDGVCGEKWRENQVRSLIALYIVDSDPDGPYREFISLSVDRVEGGGYRQTNDLAKQPTLAQCMLEDALTELRRLQTKYRRLERLKGVWDALAKV